MSKKLLLCTIVGAIALVVWSFISHVAIPWYNVVINSFENQDAVGRTIESSAPESGVYFYPWIEEKPGMTKEERAAVMEEQEKKAAEGPVLFVAVNREGIASWTPNLIVSFVINLVTAFLVSLLLITTGFSSFWKRVCISTWIGLIVVVVSDLQYWNWYSFSCGYTLVIAVDTLIAFFLMGLAIAKFATPRPEAAT
jgi:hypothetical protein